MSTALDLDINRGIRRVMVKHWVDLGRMSVRTMNGNVVLYGRMHRLPSAQNALTPRIMEAMFFEMHRVKGVHRINAHLENWSNDDGYWRELTVEEQKEVVSPEGGSDVS